MTMTETYEKPALQVEDETRAKAENEAYVRMGRAAVETLAFGETLGDNEDDNPEGYVSARFPAEGVALVVSKKVRDLFQDDLRTGKLHHLFELFESDRGYQKQYGSRVNTRRAFFHMVANAMEFHARILHSAADQQAQPRPIEPQATPAEPRFTPIESGDASLPSDGGF